MSTSSSDVAEALIAFMCSDCSHFKTCKEMEEKMNDQVIACINRRLIIKKIP